MIHERKTTVRVAYFVGVNVTMALAMALTLWSTL